MIQIIVAVLSFLLYAYSIYCIIREMKNIDVGKNLTKNQKQVRLPILMYLLALFCFLSYWFLTRKGFPVGLSLEKIDADLFVILLISSQVSTSITRHFRKERTGELLILNYKKELYRAMSFGFSKKEEFEKIAKAFIDKKFKQGVEVFYVDSASEGIENLKYLKKGEIEDFGFNSWLEKDSEEEKHKYIYHNGSPLVFGIHVHLSFAEKIKPLDEDIELYIFNKSKMKKIVLKVGETYIIPQGVEHAVIFSKANRIALEWN